MDIVGLFIAAWIPVMKMLLVTGIGSFIAADFLGFFGEEARKHVNNILFFVFNPCLVATNLSQTFTLEKLVSTWFMPINILLTFVIGSAFGWMLNKITKAPSHLRPLLLGCCASGNLGVMLLIVVPGTCYEKGSPFGDAAICHAHALAYASLSMGINDVVFWSYVYNMVRLSLRVEKSTVHLMDPEASAPESIVEETDMVEGTKSTTIEVSNAQRTLSTEAPVKKHVQALKDMAKSLHQKSTMISIINLFTPSTYGVIIGLLIGGISPIKNALIGDKAPLRAIQGAVDMLGDGAVPVSTLIMGGNLIKGFRKSDTRVSYIIGVALVRYLFLPLVGIFIVKGAFYFGLIHPDPLYHFVLLVQYALPPAMNMSTTSQLFGIGECECSVIFFWTYAITLFLFPLWSALFMWIVS